VRYAFPPLPVQPTSVPGRPPQPASSPPLLPLALHVGDLRWLFDVWPDAGHSPGNAVVTVQDVLLAIYFHLRMAAKGDEYEAMSKFGEAEISRGTEPIKRGKRLQACRRFG
jgi:uncharacterized protein DUF6699